MSDTMLKEAQELIGTETMKAAVVQSFDEPLRIEQVAKPVAGGCCTRRGDPYSSSGRRGRAWKSRPQQ